MMIPRAWSKVELPDETSLPPKGTKLPGRNFAANGVLVIEGGRSLVLRVSLLQCFEVALKSGEGKPSERSPLGPSGPVFGGHEAEIT